jgi:signal peptidase I
VRRWLALFLLAAAACGQSLANIEGQAMAPTLKDGDRALLSREFTTLERGDIVAFKYPRDESKSFIKRIVGIPGDRLESAEGRITLNGQALEEAYVAEANRSRDSWGPITVPEGEYFMLGDNRRNSSDSRMWGSVRRDAIWGKSRVR